MRDWINAFVEKNTDQIEKDWKALDPKDRIVMFEKLLKYSLPTLQATSLTTSFDNMSEEDLDRIIDGLKKATEYESAQSEN